jgi:hypothetical protein
MFMLIFLNTVISYQLSVISYQLSVISYQLSAISKSFLAACSLLESSLLPAPCCLLPAAHFLHLSYFM